MMQSADKSPRAPGRSGAPDAGSVRLRAMLLMALWLGFWLLALALVGALLWIGYAQMHYHNTLEFSGIAAALAALSLAWSLRPHRSETQTGKARPLPRDAARELYALVDRIAHKLGVKAPVDIHLIGAASAFIGERHNWFGSAKRLQVGLGIPLLGTLSKAELCAVIAHEFGHFAAGDLKLGPWVYRTRISIAHTVHELDDSMFFFDILFRRYGEWFLRISQRVSREQEFAADALAARHFGAKTIRTALEKVHLIEPMWSAYMDHELYPALNRGSRLPIFDGFRRFCKPGDRRPEVSLSLKRSEEQPTDDYDSHPSLEDRVAALVPGSKPGYPPLSECLALLGGEQAAEDAWYVAIKATQLARIEWDNFGSEVLKPQVEKRFSGSWMTPQKLPLTELPALTGKMDELWRRLKPDGLSLLSPQGKRHYVEAILEEWIIACLCQQGFVPHVSPGRPLVMQRGIQQVYPASLLQHALRGKLKAANLSFALASEDAVAEALGAAPSRPAKAPGLSAYLQPN
jgi:Zn-dependent protease with chaperone function